jgi:hypothetical protein
MHHVSTLLPILTLHILSDNLPKYALQTTFLHRVFEVFMSRAATPTFLV